MISTRLAGLVLAAWIGMLGPSFAVPAAQFIHAAAALENKNISFDREYRRIPYPMGDVPPNVGVCADVVVRAYRGVGIDLQKLVHEDMERHFVLYPKIWGLPGPDANIDHRRVLNLRVFFARHGTALKITNDPRDYRPGDLVTWNLDPRGSTPHIGIVMPRRSANGKRPLILHNMGSGQIYEDVLFAFKITGHYRYALTNRAAPAPRAPDPASPPSPCGRPRRWRPAPRP
ncbi:MAG TPA: DUF1287 domain-containing protein [Rhizomicrobium sp.]